MNQVFGEMKLVVSYGVESNEDYGVLEANYNLNPERIVGVSKLIVVDHNGKHHELVVHNIDELELNDFVEGY